MIDELIEKLSNNARKQALEEYSKDGYYNKLINIYNKLLVGAKNEG